ncbi:hypothetical protein LguiB_010059 [Lonicera macranthoides]
MAEDKNKRRLSRTRDFRDAEKPINSCQQKNSSNCKFSKSKLLLLVIILGAFFTLLHSPAVHITDHHLSASDFRPNLVDRSAKDKYSTDDHYISHLDVSWDQISTVTDKLTHKKEYQAIGLLNFNDGEIQQWKQLIPEPEHIILHLDFVAKNVTWETLYPEWIDEEEKRSVPTCPTLPELQVAQKKRIDFIAIKLPCKKSVEWSRDVARLHLQLAAARLAAKGYHPVHVLLVTDCLPVPNLFTCKELVAREGNAWLYEPNLDALREKVRLPAGSCELSIPLKAKGQWHSRNPKREAYATILHSAQVYVCGAITAAQSIRMSGSTRDLIILVDESITEYHRKGLEAAGWKVRTIQRIRNPKAQKEAYNEFNYSKFRLWQLTDYDKIIFIDADMLILRNIDILFQMPDITATGNNGTLFNSGVMVIEPSNCTFEILMDHVDKIESYNGGDQGYLNEIFVWWHRVPKHMNFLKHFWEGDEEKTKEMKVNLFGANPPILYVLHYLGIKPWLCFRDYDCNWNVDRYHEYASDVAHKRWWSVHDKMPKKLHKYCELTTHRKAALEWDRRQAEAGKYHDGHWKIEIRDKRLMICSEKYCFWKKMLRHWGEPRRKVNRTANHGSTAANKVSHSLL